MENGPEHPRSNESTDNDLPNFVVVLPGQVAEAPIGGRFIIDDTIDVASTQGAFEREGIKFRPVVDSDNYNTSRSDSFANILSTLKGEAESEDAEAGGTDQQQTGGNRRRTTEQIRNARERRDSQESPAPGLDRGSRRTETAEERAAREAENAAREAAAREHSLAFAGRQLRASEIRSHISPDLVRELTQRNPVMTHLLGANGGKSIDLLVKIQGEIRAQAHEPESFDRMALHLTTLANYFAGPYKEIAKKTQDACKTIGLDPKKFAAIMKDARQSDKQLALMKEIRRGYGFGKKLLYFFTAGIAFSGRLKSRYILKEVGSKYSEAEARLTELSNDFVATLNTARIETTQLAQNQPQAQPSDQTSQQPSRETRRGGNRRERRAA